jgi:BCD family chlorophyll transporter-like MFS transporter
MLSTAAPEKPIQMHMNWRKVAQLSLVHIGVSITVVPVTSTLNRVMIAELGFSALAVGLLVSLPYLLAPLQVIMGAWSDRNPLWGRYRSPWIVLGGLLAAFGSYLTAHAAFLTETNPWMGIAACLLAFTMWGVGVNIASVSYLSLTTELSEDQPQWRNRAVSVMWIAMILSTIVTSIALSIALRDYSESALYTAFGAVWAASVFLVLIGAARLEPASEPGTNVHTRASNPMEAIRALSANPSAQRFFIYLLLVLISIHAQDVLLEPYGAQVLGMSVAQTSRLTSIWGVGVLISMLAGLPVIRRHGKKPVANMGAFVAAVGFATIIASGSMGSQKALFTAVLILGLGGGLMTVSNLSFMLDMTVPQAAGLYVGAWGVANFAGQALGNIISGLLRDGIYAATGSNFLGYSLVFGLEIVGLLTAVWLFREISVAQFQRDARVQLSDVLAHAAD